MPEKPASVWEKHKAAIVFGSFTILLVAMLIFFLLKLNLVL